MTIFDSVMGTINTAVDTITSVTQTLVDKNRTNAKLNRLRLVMKTESELMNRAYIALGKTYYDSKKKGTGISSEEQDKLFSVIEKSKAKIAKARECYRKIVDSQNDIFYGTPENVEYDSSDIVDITVACSNENEYESSPFENIVPSATEKEETQVETAESDKPEATDKLSDLKEELKSKISGDSFSQAVDSDEAEDSESPQNELF